MNCWHVWVWGEWKSWIPRWNWSRRDKLCMKCGTDEWTVYREENNIPEGWVLVETNQDN